MIRNYTLEQSGRGFSLWTCLLQEEERMEAESRTVRIFAAKAVLEKWLLAYRALFPNGQDLYPIPDKVIEKKAINVLRGREASVRN